VSTESPNAGCPRFVPVACIFRLVTPVLRALTWALPYSEGDSSRCHSYRSSCTIRPTQLAHSTFPISGNVFRAHPLSP
jgi:hypothetical protein